jgi:hypothetical protein
MQHNASAHKDATYASSTGRPRRERRDACSRQLRIAFQAGGEAESSALVLAAGGEQVVDGRKDGAVMLASLRLPGHQEVTDSNMQGRR